MLGRKHSFLPFLPHGRGLSGEKNDANNNFCTLFDLKLADRCRPFRNGVLGKLDFIFFYPFF